MAASTTRGRSRKAGRRLAQHAGMRSLLVFAFAVEATSAYAHIPAHSMRRTEVGRVSRGAQCSAMLDAEARAKQVEQALELETMSDSTGAGSVDFVNPKMGGVVISGSRGTAKSVMARAVHSLLPPIEIVKGNQFNSDLESGEFDSFLKADLASGKVKMEDLETEIIEPPFVQIPLDVLEDRLLGSVDVEKSVRTGNTVFEPGLLAQAHRGVLYVDDINLLDESASNLLLEALSTGWVTVEREGLSVRHPCRPLLIATFNPEEAELREHLMDRIGTCLSADAEPLAQDDRLEAVQRALDFAADPQAFIKSYGEVEDQMRTSIIFAREYLKGLRVNKEQAKYLCEEAVRAGVQGHRGEIFAVEAARANAALNGRDRVEADDLKMGVRLCIAPRGTQISAPPEDEMMQQPPPPPPPQQQDDTEEPEKEESGSRGMIFSEERGRYIKPILPRGKVRKLAVDATMRTAAPYQKRRRARAEEAAANGDNSLLRGVYIEQSDVRSKKMARKAGSLVIFVVDASGSMALNRMNAAKGAAINLLGEAYQSRDKICLITFQGDYAQVILPPTRSIAMAKNRLERMPCGGGSPLSHALNQAAQVGLTAQKTGDVGEVLVVCISDGRANVPLSTSVGEPSETPMEKNELKEEVLKTAKMLGCLPNFKVLMLDTENKFVSTGLAQEIARAAQGKYHYIPKASEQAVGAVASQAIADMKSR